ncbi:Hypothetical predicted protein [Xyrichtys novacula]|uniref:Uncharacterized protein n=1 Tax=Xyrichtys novacula TaxID=13765 RepID=A0AAV1GM88_XYRNO|nr:Hypothetical predicted protein [Xyrichtys novacula]
MALGVGLKHASATGPGLCHETCMCANHKHAGIHTATEEAKLSSDNLSSRKKGSHSAIPSPASWGNISVLCEEFLNFADTPHFGACDISQGTACLHVLHQYGRTDCFLAAAPVHAFNQEICSNCNLL